MNTIKNIEILATCAMLSNPAIAQQPLFRPGYGDEKHLLFSGMAYIAAEQGLYQITKDKNKSEVGAFISSSALGAGKEFIWDYALGKGVPSMRDMKYNMYGIIGAYFINKGINRLLKRNKKKRIKHQNYRNRF